MIAILHDCSCLIYLFPASLLTPTYSVFSWRPFSVFTATLLRSASASPGGTCSLPSRCCSCCCESSQSESATSLARIFVLPFALSLNTALALTPLFLATAVLTFSPNGSSTNSTANKTAETTNNPMTTKTPLTSNAINTVLLYLITAATPPTTVPSTINMPGCPATASTTALSTIGHSAFIVYQYTCDTCSGMRVQFLMTIETMARCSASPPRKASLYQAMRKVTVLRERANMCSRVARAQTR